MKVCLLCLLLLLTLPLPGCAKKDPLIIGFIGSITGKNSDLGIAGRDATLLAAETINANGGINGRMIKVIVKDDMQTAEVAVKAVAELTQDKAVAIVGPMGSAIAKAIIPEGEKARLVMVSPTASSNELSGKDDYFFRVMEPNQVFAQHLAETCIRLKVKRVAAIYDLQNRTYTVDIFEAFRSAFTSLGGTISAEVTYDSTTKPAFLPLVQKLGLSRADGVMVLANSVDAIVIGQQIRKTTQSLPILSGACGIAQRDLLQQAGKALDNFIFTVPVNSQSVSPDYVAFRDAFSKRFNYQPTFAAVLAYDAARALFAGLQKNPDPSRLKETLQSIQSFTGVQGPIRLDRFGDPNRKLFIYRSINGMEEIVE